MMKNFETLVKIEKTAVDKVQSAQEKFDAARNNLARKKHALVEARRARAEAQLRQESASTFLIGEAIIELVSSGEFVIDTDRLIATAGALRSRRMDDDESDVLAIITGLLSPCRNRGSSSPEQTAEISPSPGGQSMALTGHESETGEKPLQVGENPPVEGAREPSVADTQISPSIPMDSNPENQASTEIRSLQVQTAETHHSQKSSVTPEYSRNAQFLPHRRPPPRRSSQ